MKINLALLTARPPSFFTYKIAGVIRHFLKSYNPSHNKLKAKRIQLAKLWRKVRLQREDYCHKVTTDLTKRYRTLIFEKLSISNMVKNHNLATSILDATWYKIKQLTGCLQGRGLSSSSKGYNSDLF
jgi:Probable transposase